jgi:hypothetical protein
MKFKIFWNFLDFPDGCCCSCQYYTAVMQYNQATSIEWLAIYLSQNYPAIFTLDVWTKV